jgi:hypothetical protein
MILKQLDLMRQRRLREIEQLRGANQTPCFAQCDQGAKVANLKNRWHHEKHSC